MRTLFADKIKNFFPFKGELFAKAPINRLNSIDFEPVVDSSRYFVIRLRSDNGQARFVGIGFSDQSDSFDLKVSIQDYFRSALEVEKEIKAEESGIKKKPSPKTGILLIPLSSALISFSTSKALRK